MECEIHLKLGAPRERMCVSLARAKISVGGLLLPAFWHCWRRASHAHDARRRAVESANAIPFIKIKTPPAFYDFISTALNMCVIHSCDMEAVNKIAAGASSI